jgi:hypothetical protein
MTPAVPAELDDVPPLLLPEAAEVPAVPALRPPVPPLAWLAGGSLEPHATTTQTSTGALSARSKNPEFFTLFPQATMEAMGPEPVPMPKFCVHSSLSRTAAAISVLNSLLLVVPLVSTKAPCFR